jgi:hypothetical protein
MHRIGILVSNSATLNYPGTGAHVYSPSYSGDRDREGLNLKSAQPNGSQDPISKKKKTHHKKGPVEWLKV